jgi:hypothetical protein
MPLVRRVATTAVVYISWYGFRSWAEVSDACWNGFGCDLLSKGCSDVLKLDFLGGAEKLLLNGFKDAQQLLEMIQLLNGTTLLVSFNASGVKYKLLVVYENPKH